MKNMSLAARQAILTILMGFVPFALIMIGGYAYISDLSTKEQVSSRYYSIKSVATAMNYAISNFDALSQYIIGSEPVRDFLLSAAPAGTSEALRVRSNASNAMALLPFTSSAGQTCAVFSMDGRKISRGVNDQIEITQAEKERCEAMGGKWFWSVDGDSLAMCRLLRDKEWVANWLGYIKILVRKDSLAPLFDAPRGMDDANYTFVLYDFDLGGTLMDNANPASYAWMWDALDMDAMKREAVGDFRLRDGQAWHLAMTYRLEGGHSVLIALTDDSAARYHTMMVTMAGWALVLSLALIALQILIFRQIAVRPLKKIGSLMASVENEDFGVSFHIRGKDEIAQLAQRFNSMALRLKQLHEEVYQGQLSMRAAEIKILEKEINPHFLFNTLNTIYWTIQVGNTAAAGQMIQDLSNLFRLSMYRVKDDLVPLDMELQHIRCYLALEHMRLGEALRYSVDAQPGLQGAKVIKLVLQPLVENAILHGIGPQEGGEVLVSVYLEGDDLCYMIYDSGVGADPERIEGILRTKGHDADHGIALYNVHERIALKFGPRYGVTYRRPADGGSAFIVRQPFCRGQAGQGGAI